MGEMLLNDIHPRRCNTSDDCILRNLSTSPCVCGLDGYSYCQAQWGSEVFDGYWQECNASDNQLPYNV